MNFELKNKLSTGWVVASLSFIGVAGFYLWQPISELFITRAFDENVILQLDTDTLKLDAKNQLLVVHIKITNRGSVPATIMTEDDRGSLMLEVRRIR